nr:hypothetical protein 19 [Saccharospirillaceae bacterium]
MVGPDTAKDVVHARLMATVLSDHATGPGLIHWPSSEPHGSEFTHEFFTHLTNEERVAKVEKGRRVVVWDAKGKRNEPWDLEVYNLAAIRLLQQRFGVNLRTLTNPFAADDKATEEPSGEPVPAKASTKATPKPATKPRRKPVKRTRTRTTSKPKRGWLDE